MVSFLTGKSDRNSECKNLSSKNNAKTCEAIALEQEECKGVQVSLQMYVHVIKTSVIKQIYLILMHGLFCKA